MQLEVQDKYLKRKEELQNKIATLTGGRAAEEIVTGTISTGASNDIEQATKLARAMITRYGMTEEFDMVAMETVNNQYLGGDTSLACSADTQKKIDEKVVEVVKEQHKKALDILNENLVLFFLLVLFLSGVVGVLWGIGRAVFSKTATNGIWFTGIGVVLTVLALLLCAGYNNTAYYPSTADLQSSLTLANSCSSEFTLRTMAYVSILVPFVLAYIIYAWRAIDRKPITAKELEQDGHAY